MIITNPNLINLFAGYKTSFNKGFDGAESSYQKIAMIVPSSGSEENYAWMGQFPKLREWIGDRILNNLSLHSYTIKNRTFESTVEVARTNIEDDKYGLFAPMFEEMGRDAKTHPDQLVYELLAGGFSNFCYDGQYFFDTDHIGYDADGKTISVSNKQDGTDPAWFLLDVSRPIKPLVFQERLRYALQRLDADSDYNVFMQDKYIYGVRARVNAGFGLWQMAFGSKAPLTAENYAAARASMSKLRGENGKPLGIRPTILIVPPDLEGDGRKLLVNQTTDAGAGNEWAGTGELIVAPYLP